MTEELKNMSKDDLLKLMKKNLLRDLNNFGEKDVLMKRTKNQMDQTKENKPGLVITWCALYGRLFLYIRDGLRYVIM